jgi:hypothetical protein
MAYDIINDYDWTSMPKGSPLRYDTPQLFVKAYELNKNQTINRFRNYVTVATEKDPLKFYDKLYSDATTPTEDYYLFPFFGDNIRSFTNTFGDTFKNGFGGTGVGQALDSAIQSYGGAAVDVAQIASSVAGPIGSALKNMGLNSIGDKLMQSDGDGNAGSYIETPKFYDFTSASEGPLEVNFVLSNTIDSASIEKNYNFIKHIIKHNRPYRIDAISMTPPRIYEVTLKGWRYMRWAYCNSLNVSFLGARKMIGDKIVPEGYSISMSFTPLTIEPANFVDFLSETGGQGFSGAVQQAGPPQI